MKKVLVLCTGNSCRSIMAEALINSLGDGQFEAVSAGSQPAGYVHPKSLAILEQHGLNTSGYYSKSWDEFADTAFDIVITVCDSAAAETCPAFPGQFTKLHWSTPDPAQVTDNQNKQDEAFLQAFEFLKSRIQQELL